MRQLNANKDRFGIGWRPELAAGILCNLDRIDVVEVIADDFFEAPRNRRRAIATLAAQTPVVLHGVTLGMASASPVEVKLLERTARLFDEVRPEYWSEHLAFVRAGGVEIGHLTAPPRTASTVESAAANLELARRVVGVAPLVENIATLIDPPASQQSESEWVGSILHSSGCNLLLDLHNLHANAANFGFDPRKFIDEIPADTVASIHLAGGKWVGTKGQRRVLDDHLHDVPDPVYELLAYVGSRVSRKLTVILERDGAYPPMNCLLDELDRARKALADGRSRMNQNMNQELASTERTSSSPAAA
jgi:uncharacterized protein